jgi:hypothetical protein
MPEALASRGHDRPVPTVPTSGLPVRPDGRGIIAVERIRGPVFLLCGDQDLLWPSCAYADAMARRLHGHPHAPGTRARRRPPHRQCGAQSPQASNSISLNGRELLLGGSVQDDALARFDARPKLLRFLAD